MGNIRGGGEKGKEERGRRGRAEGEERKKIEEGEGEREERHTDQNCTWWTRLRCTWRADSGLIRTSHIGHCTAEKHSEGREKEGQVGRTFSSSQPISWR